MKLPHVSPSQVATRRGCQRKWWYSRNRPRTSNRFAAFGTRTHTILEGWLTHHTLPGEDTPERACAIAGLPHLPMPRTVWCETPIDFVFEGVPYVGFVDALGWDGVVATVIDHKTCGSFEYAHTPETLLDDPQRIIYSYSACLRFGASWARARWVYYRRKPPAARPVELVEDAHTIARRFVDLHQRDGLPIFQAALSGAPVDAFPRTLTECGKYGGCPYEPECKAGVSPIDLAVAAMKGQPPMDLNAHLQANAAGAAPPPPMPPIADTRPSLTPEYAQAIGTGQGDVAAMIAYFQLRPDEVAELKARFAPPPAVPPMPPLPGAAPNAADHQIERINAAFAASDAVLQAGGTADQARAAYEQTLAQTPQAPPGVTLVGTDTRAPEQKAPRKRRQRSDAGQPRGPRKGAAPVDVSNVQPSAVVVPSTPAAMDDARALAIGRLVLEILEIAG